MKKRLLAAVLSLAMILALAACGAKNPPASDTNPPSSSNPEQTQQGNEPSTPAGDPVKVTLSAQPAAHSLGIFAAKENGWFAEEGLDVEILTYISGPPQLEAVASDAWSVGIMGIAAGVTGAITYDLTTLGFSVWDYPSQRLFVRADSDIAQAGKGGIDGYPDIYGTADLWRGKDIICTKGSLGYLQLLASLKAIGLTEDDVNVIHMEMAAGYQAFLVGEGDALCAWSTFASDAAAEGYVEASSAAAAQLYVPSVILASDAALADKEVTQKIVNVIFRGNMWVNEHKDEAAQLYYDICVDEGVTCTMEYAKEYLNEHSAPTIDEYREMAENGEYEKILADVMEYYIAAGSYTQEDADKVVASFDGEILENAIKYYEEHYAG